MEFFKQLPVETLFFMSVIVICGFLFHAKFTDRAAHNGPTILTTIGIFATFFGIALALWHFNTTDIQASLPSLLNGLKTAFLSSTLGILLALTLKGREFVWGVQSAPNDAEPTGDATAADIVNQLRKVTDALVGREEGSLISQIKLSRQDSNDRLDALKAAQTEALAKLSELGSKALVEALRDVIRDFNQKLAEQFGENFKQLNSAVGKLLTWQEQYKGIVETTVQKFGEVGALMAKATADYSALVEKSEAFTKAADDLKTLLTTFTSEATRLQTVSEALAKLLRSAEGSLPQVEQKVLALTSQLTNAVMENQKQVGTALAENATATRNALQSVQDTMSAKTLELTSQLTQAVTEHQKQVGRALTENATVIQSTIRFTHESMASAHREHSTQSAELVAKTKEQITVATSQLTNAVTENQKQLSSALTENATAIRNTLQSANENMSTGLKEHSTKITELVAKTKEQVTVLDKALSEGLEKSLVSLGTQLAVLSEKFVEDYTPLTEELRRVVQLSSRVVEMAR
jgi:hypothetical protein